MTLSPDALRQACGNFATGVTVMTVLDGQGRALGVTANSFTSVSLEPPLVLWCLRKEASIHPVFMESGRFGVSILAADQAELSNRQAARDSQVLAAGQYSLSEDSVPLISGAVTSLVCRTVRRDEGGDHTIFLAEIEKIIDGTGDEPLLFFKGGYHQLGPVTG